MGIDCRTRFDTTDMSLPATKFQPHSFFPKTHKPSEDILEEASSSSHSQLEALRCLLKKQIMA
jgi:hypothetical protein